VPRPCRGSANTWPLTVLNRADPNPGNFSLDAHVPGDHLLRSIDRFVDLSELRRELAPFYSMLGRPSIDPELMIRMLIVGYAARLLGDSAYGSAEMLGWLVYEHGIEPHVTVFDKSTRRDGTFSRDDFTYDHVGDVYSCPAGKMLTTTGSRVNDGTTLRYRASKYDCEACRLKPRCCPKEPARKIPRSVYEGARDMAREIAKSWQGRTSRRLRKKIEMLFAHLKRILKLDRLRLRGPNGARDEFLLAATAQNLRKLAKLIPIPNLKPA